MRFKLLVSVLVVAAACTGFQLPGFIGGKGSTQQTSATTNKTEETHTINGHPVDRNGNREDAEPRASKQVAAAPGKAMGKTCHKNDECASEACYVGYGDLGYCTKMCDSWSDCPSFYECKKAANAPQRICMQGKD
jgi:hypothetical protein